MTHNDNRYAPATHGIGFWLVMVLAVIVGVFGLLITGGGAWLLTLGGSWYYVIAGIGLLATSFFLFRRRMLAVWIYLATFVFTLVWALWEAGFDGWAQVPRLLAPTLVLIAILAAIPALRGRYIGRYGAVTASFAGLIAMLGAGGVLVTSHYRPVLAQESAPAAQATPPAATPAPDAAPVSPAPTGETQPGAAATPATAPQGGTTTTAVAAAPTTPTGVSVRGATAMAEAGTDWPVYGGTVHETRYSPLDEINRDNVGTLEHSWTFHTGDLPNEATKGEYSPETTPIKIGDSIYLCSATNKLIALDAGTGLERWQYDPAVPDDAIPYGATCRGVAYYADTNAAPDSACATRIIEGTLDARLIAVDARTGTPCAEFGTSGNVDLSEGIGDTVPGWYGHVAIPVIVRGIVVVGAQVLDGQAEDAPSGVIRGYDAVTGKLAWAWDMCNPALTGAPPEGQVYTRGTPNMWTAPAGDEDLGFVYVPLGNSAVDYYGGNRSACENEYSSSLVALDVTTGKEAWHFQTVHYDVWDYDLGSQPSLVDIPGDNGTTPAVVLPSKQGEIYVLNRQTGESLFPVEERPVPTGGVEPENLSKTQPFSGYHTLAKAPLQEKDMWGMSPLDQLWCRIQFRQAAYAGEYTPPTVDQRYIQYPGYNGGSDWGSVAIDPERGLLIANYNDMPNYNRLLTRDEAEKRGIVPINVPGQNHDNPQAGSPYAVDINAGWRESWTGLMCKEPPYGGIRAIDLKTGKTVWDEPLGQARENGPFGIPSMLPVVIGTPNNGGSVVTAGGLIFIAAATDNLIRAIDIDTGKVLWTDTLPAGGQANPMTFEADGKQYVTLMTGGHHFMETPVGDEVIAWALPEASNG